jgi:rhodanese-related sulfurtransferase
MIALSRNPSLRFSVFILLQKKKGNSKFIEELRIGRGRHLEVDLWKSGVKATPTLWVVGQDRQVLLAYLGRLSHVTQGRIEGILRGQLQASAAWADYFPEISSHDLRNLEFAKDAQIIDVRPRIPFSQNHRRGALNIPLDELSVRAPEEMDFSKPAVIDCSWSDPRMCDSAAYQLGRAGFRRVYIFNRGATPPSSCETELTSQ